MIEYASIRIMIKRDFLRFWRQRVRIISGLSFPIIWLLVFGPSLGGAVAGTQAFGSVGYTTFLFPGILASSLVFSAIGSAISIVHDREFGFLKEVLVAPVSRLSIAIAKTLSGALISTISALPIIFIAPLAGVHLTAEIIAGLIPGMLLIATALSGLGVLIASRLKSTESGQFVFQFLIFPMFFLSGALAPVETFPAWLKVIVAINPVTYSVDLLRRINLSGLDVPAQAAAQLSATVAGYPLSISLDIGIISLFAVIMVGLGVTLFAKAE